MFIGRRLNVITLLGVLLAAMMSFNASAQGEKISVVEAHERVQNNDIILVDVRTEGEWKETGVAPGAVTLTMHQKGGLDEFSHKLQDLIDKNPDKQIALICAGGVRTHHAQAFLEKRGFTNILDVKEGMVGGFFKKGWVDHEFPVEPYKK